MPLDSKHTKATFHQIRQICCAYNSLRCLHLQIWRFLCPQLKRQWHIWLLYPLCMCTGVISHCCLFCPLRAGQEMKAEVISKYHNFEWSIFNEIYTIQYIPLWTIGSFVRFVLFILMLFCCHWFILYLGFTLLCMIFFGIGCVTFSFVSIKCGLLVICVYWFGFMVICVFWVG